MVDRLVGRLLGHFDVQRVDKLSEKETLGIQIKLCASDTSQYGNVVAAAAAVAASAAAAAGARQGLLWAVEAVVIARPLVGTAS